MKISYSANRKRLAQVHTTSTIQLRRKQKASSTKATTVLDSLFSRMGCFIILLTKDNLREFRVVATTICWHWPIAWSMLWHSARSFTDHFIHSISAAISSPRVHHPPPRSRNADSFSRNSNTRVFGLQEAKSEMYLSRWSWKAPPSTGAGIRRQIKSNPNQWIGHFLPSFFYYYIYQYDHSLPKNTIKIALI